jgi:hypothetical protein
MRSFSTILSLPHGFPVPIAPTSDDHSVVAKTAETSKAPVPIPLEQLLGNLTPPFVYGPAERLTCCKCALAVLLDAAAPASKEQRIVEARFSKDFRCVDANQMTAL